MKKVTAVLGFIFGLLLFVVPPVYAGDIDSGKRVFTANCTACHVGGKNVVQAAKTLKQDALETYLDNYGTEHNISAIVYQVVNGKNAMPAFGGRLTAEQIEDVAAYVNSQAEKNWIN